MITHTLNLELAKKIDSIGVPIVIRTMDNETQVIAATLFMHGQDYAPACDSARLDIMHEDGAWAHVDAQVSGNVASATLPSKALGTGGAAMAYFAFIKGKQIETTESFALRMEKSAQATPESDRYFDASINRIYEKWKNFNAAAEHAEDLRKAAEVKRESDFADAQTRHETAYTQAEQARTSTFNQAEEERAHAENARVSAESARADAEQKRASAESARNEQESSRTGAEQARAAAESKRDSAEQTRQAAETTRDDNENTRKQAETTRADNENARAQAETTRANDENKRAAAEQGRAQAEQTRAGNEDTRKEQEQSRAAQEGLRAQAETTRNEQESLRQAQEQARKDAEQTRKDAEQTRTQAEDARTQAEQKRDLAEGTRAQAEALRVAEESKRKDAERTRATEEDARKTRFTQMMDAAQNVKFKIVQADDNGTPLGEGVAGIIYLVRGKADSATNEYTEWIWYDGRWELFGTSGATVEPITTQDIDTVAQDGTISGTRVLSATALNYLWTKLKAQYQTQAQVTAAVSAGTEPLAAKLQALDTTKADRKTTDTFADQTTEKLRALREWAESTLQTQTQVIGAINQATAPISAKLQALDTAKADKKTLEDLKTSVNTDVKQQLQALDTAKADKKTTDTFASQATQQLKALREWAESTLQSKMQEKYNEGFSRGKQEGGGAEKVFTGELTQTQIDELYGKVKNDNHLVSLFIEGAHEKVLRALMQKLNTEDTSALMQKLNTEDTSALMQKLNTEGASALMQKLNTKDTSALMQKLNTEDTSALMQKLNTEDTSALMQKLNTEGASALIANVARGDNLVYAYIDRAMQDRIMRDESLIEGRLINVLHIHISISNDRGVYALSNQKNTFSNYIFAIVSAHGYKNWDYMYDGASYRSADGMVSLDTSKITFRNAPADSYALLIFPRKNWDK